jgi:hypothetical protein
VQSSTSVCGASTSFGAIASIVCHVRAGCHRSRNAKGKVEHFAVDAAREIEHAPVFVGSDESASKPADPAAVGRYPGPQSWMAAVRDA